MMPYQPMPQQQPQQPAQQPYGGPQYSMSPAQPYAQGQQPGYDYYEYDEEPPRSNTIRWVAIGCGCLAVLCLVVLVLVAFLIDAMNLWCDVPIVPQLFNLYCPGNITSLLPMLFALI